MQDVLKYRQNKRSMLFMILLMGFVIVACSNVAHAEIVSKWDVYETELTTTNAYTNPYIDVWLSAIFTGPDGTKITIDGFWDGENNWKIRMAPTEVGTWSYITSSSDPYLNGQIGSFDVVESGKKGFIIRDPNNASAFKRSEGENVFWMGDTCWNSMSDRNGAFPFLTYKTYIDNRADQKFNFIRTYVVSLYADSTDSSHYNEGGRAFDPWDSDNLNPNYFQEVDKRIEYANSKGITMNLVLGADRRLMTDFFSWDNGKLERYVRYLAARYSAYDIAWEGRAEFEEQGITTPDAVDLANQIGNWLEEYDPYGHVQSMHTNGSNNELGNENWLDWIMHQSRDWDLIVSDRQYNKPVMNEEFYYENSGAGVTHAHHVDADTVREGAWKVMTYGATGFAYGNTGTYNSRSQPFAGIEYSVSEGADYMTYLYDFWKTTDYWKLAPFTINDVDTTVDSSYSAGSLKIGEQWTLEVDAHTGDIVTTEPKIDANDGLNGDNPYFIRNNIRWAHNYYWYSSIKDADVEPDQWVDYVPPLNELGAGTYQISTQYREGQNRGLYPCKYIINHEGGTTTVERVQYVAEIGGPVVFDLGTYDLGTDGWVRVQDTGTVSQSMGAMYFTYKGNGDVPAEDPYDGEKAEGFAVADPGNEYVVYLPSGGYITIDLSDVSGTLSVEWYNPHTGKYQGQTTVEGGAPRAFTAPDTNDWVLYLDFKR